MAKMASALLVLMLLVRAQTQQSPLPPLEAADCSMAATFKELPNARFARKGGRTTASKVSFQSGVLSVKDVEQGRDLHKYETITLTSPKPMTVVESQEDPIIARARMFVWQHW